MKRLIDARVAANVLLVSFGALAVFHVLILLGVLPAGIAWGGGAGNAAGSLVVLEVAGLIVTGIFAAIVATKIGYLSAPRLSRAITVGMWVVFGYFVLNTLGNLASTSMVERAIFTPVTVVLALLALRLALEK